jgi:alkyl hydroperoxide reductase subunit AhpC
METQLQDYENREFMIFNVSELDKIDFTQVCETSIDTVRKSVDETKTFVKWDGEIIPLSVSSLLTKEGPYTYEEILSILSTSEWTEEMLMI